MEALHGTGKKVKGKIGYKLARVIARLREESITLRKKRNDILEQNGEKDKDGKLKTKQPGGGVVFPSPGVEEAVTKELDDINSTEIEIDYLQIPYDEKAMLELTAADFDIILPLMEKDTGE